MVSLYQVPIKNIKAHPVRTAIIFFLTLALSVSVLAGIAQVLSIRREMEKAEARLGADIIAYPKSVAVSSKLSMKDLMMQGNPVKVYKKRTLLSKLDSCEGIAEVSHQLYIEGALPDGGTIWIFGIEPRTDFVIKPWIEAPGFDFQDGKVAVGSKTPISETGSVTIFQREWPVGARLMETGSTLDSAVFVDTDTLKAMIAASKEAGIDDYESIDPDNYFSAVLIRVKDKAQVESVKNWINLYIRKVKAARGKEALTQTAQDIGSATRMVMIAFSATWGVLLLALWAIQSMLMRERKKELFVWCAIGASPNLVKRVILSEAFLIHAAGAVSGVLLASALAVVFDFLGGTMISDMICAGITALIVAVLMGMAASWIATERSMRSMDGQMLLNT